MSAALLVLVEAGLVERQVANLLFGRRADPPLRPGARR